MMINSYFKIWALFIPITSVILIPSVKGTLISYFFAAFSSIVGVKYYKKCDYILPVKFIYCFCFVLFTSQLFVTMYNNWLPHNLLLVDKTDLSTAVFRSSMLTQSLYLLPCILTFVYVKAFYNESWDKWIFYGGNFFAIYGIYEFVYFLLTGENGDFLSNRWFGDDDEIVGSAFQQVTLGGITIERLKSLTGEASMYAYIMLAYWIYAIHTERNKLSMFYFFSLLLSTSTSGFLGMLLYFLYRMYKYRKYKEFVVAIFLISILLLFWSEYISDAIDNLILAKIYMENHSGEERGGFIFSAMEVFSNSPIFIQLFGWGWGVIRSTDFFSTLIINTGIVGLLLWTAFVLIPCTYKISSYRVEGIKAILIIEYVIMMVSVPEFSFLSYWLFLGIAYNLSNKTL